MDNDTHFIGEWLDANYPDYAQSDLYRRLQSEEGLEGDELINETASCLWITTNTPNHQQIISDTRDELIREIDKFAGLKDIVDYSAVFGRHMGTYA